MTERISDHDVAEATAGDARRLMRQDLRAEINGLLWSLDMALAHCEDEGQRKYARNQIATSP